VVVVAEVAVAAVALTIHLVNERKILLTVAGDI